MPHAEPEVDRRRLADVLCGPFADLVSQYLKTVAAPDVVFVHPRSGDIDALLCRLVLDGEEVSGSLFTGLVALFAGRVQPSELSRVWCEETASIVHSLGGLDERLIAYVQAHWQEQQRLFGIVSDDERTEPPEPWLPPAIEGPPATAAGTIEEADQRPAEQLAELGDDSPTEQVSPRSSQWRALADTDRGRFFAELEREVARGHRGLGPMSVVLIKVSAAGGQRAIDQVRDRLRPYDACCRLGRRRLGLILPGASGQACGSVVARLRRPLEGGEDQGSVGAATWPEDGINAAALLDHAERALEADKRRRKSGEVEFDSVPPYMAETEDERRGQDATLWLDELQGELPVVVEGTVDGVRLRAPLSFLQPGSWIRVRTSNGRTVRGRVSTVSMGPGSGDEPPVLQLEVLPPGG